MTESARAIVEVQRRLVALPVPVVARLDGPVRAGGLGLVACSDVVVCRVDGTFALTEVRRGLAAATSSIPRRARLTPRGASDWFLTGRRFDATEAGTHGLVTTVVDEAGMDAAVAAVLGSRHQV
jgi:enoyl-CoA hydratase/methylglutaconyl-CoA hydratase